MTIAEVIAWVDDISPNQYSDAQKLAWLSSFDGKVWEEVFLNHAGNEAEYPEGGHTQTSDMLLIGAPYAMDVYGNNLLAKIAEANAEVAKYNLYATLYNTEYAQFVS